MNELKKILLPVYHGIAMGVLALILGALWAAYMATHHEQLHGGFERQEAAQKAMEHEEADHHATTLGMISDAIIPPAVAHGDAHDADSDGHAEGSAHHHHQHSHTGSLAMDAMQRLLRGHIHFMGIGLLTVVMLIVVASTSLARRWKTLFGWTFGLGCLLYPPAWILMGFRTVQLGPEAAEASVMWLFGPAVLLLIGSLIALFVVLLLEWWGQRSTPSAP